MSRHFILVPLSFIIVLSCSQILVVECFPVQRQDVNNNVKENDNDLKKDLLSEATHVIWTAAPKNVSTSSYLRGDLATKDDEHQRTLATICEDLKCGAECYLAQDQGCGWSRTLDKCVSDPSEGVSVFDFDRGTCADCFGVRCAKQCKELESRGCSWNLFCTLDPRDTTDESELDEGSCEDPLNGPLPFPIPALVGIIFGALTLLRFLCAVVASAGADKTDNRSSPPAGGDATTTSNNTATMAPPSVIRTVPQAQLFGGVIPQAQVIVNRPELQQDENILVAMVVDEPAYNEADSNK